MRAREKELFLFYLGFDLIVLNFSIFFLAWLRLDIPIQDVKAMGLYLLHGNLSWVITYFAFSKKNLYLRDGFLNRVIRISRRVLIFFVTSAVVSFLIMPKWYSRTFYVEYTILFFFLELIAYWLLYRYVHWKRKMGSHINRVLIVGYNDTSDFLRRIIVSNPIMGYKFVGFLSNKKQGDKVLGTIDRLEEIVVRENIQMVAVSMSLLTENDSRKNYLKICNRLGVRLRFVPENQQWFASRFNLESVGEIKLLNPQEIPLDDSGRRIAKRAFDIFFSLAVILLVLSWGIPLLALIIRFSSKGPIFFIQERTGINNHTFKCIKFRSMVPNSQSDTLQATASDSRVTRVGRFMRKYNIDELPQFINVFLGQMSVVGPRPHMLKHTEEYSALIDYYKVRHYVKPGITGWAQVNGLRGDTSDIRLMQKRVEHDMEYIDNWSFWWDILIIWRTVFNPKSYKNAF